MTLPASRFFGSEEFRCKDSSPYPEAWPDRWATLSALCDAIRDAWGGPLVVVSGYRTDAYNKRLSATGHHVASSSQHVEGRAADLQPKFIQTVVTPVFALHEMILRLHQHGDLPTLGGLGIYDGWVHVDFFAAPDGHLRRWDQRAKP